MKLSYQNIVDDKYSDVYNIPILEMLPAKPLAVCQTGWSISLQPLQRMENASDITKGNIAESSV